MKNISPPLLVQTSAETFKVFAEARFIGEDVYVCIWGGDKPHIGAVAAAQPRASLADAKKRSATASVLTYLGHKEDEIVKPAAEQLSAVLDTNVVVTAGIHWDNLGLQDIQTVIKRSAEIIDVLKATLTETQKQRRSQA